MLNRIGAIMRPCLTPLDTEKGIEIQSAHFTTKFYEAFHSLINCTIKGVVIYRKVYNDSLGQTLYLRP